MASNQDQNTHSRAQGHPATERLQLSSSSNSTAETTTRSGTATTSTPLPVVHSNFHPQVPMAQRVVPVMSSLAPAPVTPLHAAASATSQSAMQGITSSLAAAPVAQLHAAASATSQSTIHGITSSLAPAIVPQLHAAVSAPPQPVIFLPFQLAPPPYFSYNQAIHNAGLHFNPPVVAPINVGNMLYGVNVGPQPTNFPNMAVANGMAGTHGSNFAAGGQHAGIAAAGAAVVRFDPSDGFRSRLLAMIESRGRKNTKTAEQLRVLAQRARARQAAGLSNSTAAAPGTAASVMQADVPAKTDAPFYRFEQLPLELQIIVWKIFLAEWCSDPNNGRIVEVWLARRELKTQNPTRNSYKFLSPTALPFVFSLCYTLAREADHFFDKMFITSYDNKEHTCIRILPEIDTVKLTPIRGIGRCQSPAAHISDALWNLDKFEPETLAAIKKIAVPVPNGNELYAISLASGLKLCGGLQKVVLLTESLPCTPKSLAAAKHFVPDGNLALGPPRFNRQTYNTWNVSKDKNLVKSKLIHLTTAERVKGIEIVAHNLISGAEQWGVVLSSTQVYVPPPKAPEKDSA